jgi:hypothetical protein
MIDDSLAGEPIKKTIPSSLPFVGLTLTITTSKIGIIKPGNRRQTGHHDRHNLGILGGENKFLSLER